MKKIIISLFVLTFIGCSSGPVIQTATPERDVANFRTCFELMADIMGYKPIYGSATGNYDKAKNLAELEEMYGGESLIEIQRNIPNAEILANNANVRKLLNAPYKVEEMKGKISSVPTKDTQTIYDAMENSNVNKNHHCYDTKGTIGFCFGRATIAHMEAIVREVHPDAVKKIWIAGDMGVWGHHVATMVHTEKGWRVLDTNQGRLVTPDQWIDIYMKEKQKNAKDIMIYITQAGRFGPYDTRSYNAIDLFNTNSDEFVKAKDYFNGYFHDYFQSLDNFKNKPAVQKK